MPITYQLGRRDSKVMFAEEFRGGEEVVHEAIRRARKARLEGPWFDKKVGYEYAGPGPLRERAENLQKRLRKNRNNNDPDRFYLHAQGSGATFIIQEIIADPGANPPPGAVGLWHPKLVQMYRINYSDDFRGQTRFGGAYNCRKNVLDDDIWSMHSDWPPVLAMDTFCSPQTDQRLRERHRQSGIDGITYVYHFGHQHAQVGGNRSGTPRCA